MECLEFTGKTTEEAIAQDCEHFQLPPESLEIEIVSVGYPGLFGLGSRPAKIRASVREAPEADLLPRAQDHRLPRDGRGAHVWPQGLLGSKMRVV